MKISLFLPGISGLKTGGNIYNEKIMHYLSEKFTCEQIVVGENSLAQEPPDSDIFLVDSLLLRKPAFVQALTATKTRPTVLIAHYLKIADPSARENSEKVSDEIKLLPRFDGFITTSEYTKKSLQDIRISPEKMKVVMPGVEPEFRDKNTVKKNGEIPEILTVSSLIPGKGLIEFTEILELLAHLEWIWHLAGETQLDRNFEVQFRKRISNSKILDRIKIHGAISQDRIVELMHHCNIFVLPSQFESLSMATMEAMTAGLPVVAFKTGGLPELFGKNQDMFLVPRADFGKFAERVTQLLEDFKLRSTLGHQVLFQSRCFATWTDSAAKFADAVEFFVKEH